MDRAEVVTTIKACLTPKLDGMAISDIEYEFEKFAGEPIPWKELGHATLMELLLTIGGVHETGRSFSGEPLLAIWDNKVEHIQNMVLYDKEKRKPRRKKPKAAMTSDKWAPTNGTYAYGQADLETEDLQDVDEDGASDDMLYEGCRYGYETKGSGKPRPGLPESHMLPARGKPEYEPCSVPRAGEQSRAAQDGYQFIPAGAESVQLKAVAKDPKPRNLGRINRQREYTRAEPEEQDFNYQQQDYQFIPARVNSMTPLGTSTTPNLRTYMKRNQQDSGRTGICTSPNAAQAKLERQFYQCSIQPEESLDMTESTFQCVHNNGQDYILPKNYVPQNVAYPDLDGEFSDPVSVQTTSSLSLGASAGGWQRDLAPSRGVNGRETTNLGGGPRGNKTSSALEKLREVAGRRMAEAGLLVGGVPPVSPQGANRHVVYHQKSTALSPGQTVQYEGGRRLHSSGLRSFHYIGDDQLHCLATFLDDTSHPESPECLKICAPGLDLPTCLRKVQAAHEIAPQVILQIGNTDIIQSVSLEATIGLLDELLEELGARGCKVVLLTLPPLVSVHGHKWPKEVLNARMNFNSWIRKDLTTYAHVTVLDIRSIFYEGESYPGRLRTEYFESTPWSMEMQMWNCYAMKLVLQYLSSQLLPEPGN